MTGPVFPPEPPAPIVPPVPVAAPPVPRVGPSAAASRGERPAVFVLHATGRLEGLVVTALRPFQSWGAISYAVYLVHWPILVLLALFTTRVATPWLVAIALFTVFPVAYVLEARLQPLLARRMDEGWQRLRTWIEGERTSPASFR